MIVIGDLHLKRYPEVYWNAYKKLFDWLLKNFKDEVIVQVGDLIDSSSAHGDVEDALAFYIKQFKEFHLVRGNHDFSTKIKSNGIKYLRQHSNVGLYEDITEVEIEGYKCLMLPHTTEQPEFSQEHFDIAFAHYMVKETSMFGEPFIDVLKLNADIIINGHIHSESKRIGNIFLTGVPLPTKNGEQLEKHFIWIIKEKPFDIEPIEVPKFLEIQDVEFDVDINTLNKDFIYNVKNAPDYQSVVQKFEGIHIREDGVELKHKEITEQDKQILTSVDVLKDKWKNLWVTFCASEDEDEEVMKLGLQYMDSML